MRVKRETPMELVAVESTEWLSYIFLAAAAVLFFTVGLHGNTPKAFIPAGVFLAIGAAWFLKTEVTFDNARREAHWKRRRLFWVKSRTVAFDEIQGVVIESMPGPNNQQTYRLTVLTKNGPVPMSDNYSGGRQTCEKLRLRVLEFLKLRA